MKKGFKMQKTTVRKVFYAILLVALLLQHGVLIAWSFSAFNYYWYDRFSGLSHNEAMCNSVEFADNIARSVGFTGNEARDIQRSAIEAYCEQ
jgi:hypothetical protein